jgi:tripartite-type tricarboxylate transporter receptor subunit TctC
MSHIPEECSMDRLPNMRRRAALGAALAAACGSAPAWAQPYPAKPIRLVVPFPAGGGVDTVARIAAQRLGALLSTTVTVENRAGASGTIGADAVAKSPPDGLTLLVASPAEVVIIPTTGGVVPYKVKSDLAPIAVLGETPLLIAAHPSLNATNLGRVFTRAKAQPGKVSYSTPGKGSAMHFAGASLELLVGIDLLHVSYRGAAPAVTDALGGQVDLTIAGMPPVLPHVKSGKLAALAVTSDKRSSALPDVPTVAETINSPGFRFTNWMAVYAPAATPADIITKLSQTFAAIVAEADTKQKMLAAGVEPMGLTGDAMRGFLASEERRYSRISKDRGITATSD